MEMKEEDRINFVWRGRYRGLTPGTIKKITNYYVVVEWDDKTSTKSSHEFILKNTKAIK